MSDNGENTLRKMKTEQQMRSKSVSSGKKSSKLSSYIPQFVKDSVSNVSVSRKQMVDATLFVGGIYCMYKFGSTLSDKIDSFMPNEEQMLKMM